MKTIFFNVYSFQIRRVDPTLDMEADEGDDYIHIQVRSSKYYAMSLSQYLVNEVGCHVWRCIFLLHMYTHVLMIAKVQDHGLSRGDSKDVLEPQYEPYRRSFSQNLNQHGAVVLQGRIIGKTPVTNHPRNYPISSIAEISIDFFISFFLSFV